jgi:tetratricopeptide repeat protein/cytochrome c554/c'-like protein
MSRHSSLFFSSRRHISVGAIWIIGFAAIALLCTGVRKANARQNEKAIPAQPTQPQYLNARPGVEYVGDEACGKCHSTIYAEFKRTGMGRSVSVPSAEDARELAKPATIINRKLNRTYSIYARDGKVFHEESESDSKGHITFSETHEIAYSVGAGDVGKSYLVAKGDALFVSPISYYKRINGWDLSPGYADGIFHGFTRRVVDLCVDCHTGMPQPVPGSHNRFQQPPFRFLTVGCERCHGPGAIHVQQRMQEAAFDGPGQESFDYSIVNPRKLGPEVRDDVCAQCHFAGDARVLQPGKDYLDFRPGTALGDVVATFSVPQSIKGSHFVALDQFEQVKMSRCWTVSNGGMGCISCHDPHVQLGGEQAVDFFRNRCLKCHAPGSCREPLAQRQATSPPDNCIQCHMPKQPSENIGHSSITDHRILRTQSEIPAALDTNGSPPPTDLIYDTKPSSPGQPQMNLRNLALAYAQTSSHYPELGEKGLALLEQAAAAFPTDPEVQAAYGSVLRVARPREEQRATEAFQKALDGGSKTAEVRTQLARLRLRQGQVTAAMELYKQSIQIDPYFIPAYLDLAQIYSMLKDRKGALETLDSILNIDPGNAAARQERLKASALPDDK